MIKLIGSEDYYPTPESLLDEITAGLDWEKIYYVLEPSAGQGAICEWLMKERTQMLHDKRWGNYTRKYNLKLDLDSIELESEFRAILKDKGFRVVHDDFLTFRTYKHYDLILMNPPFSTGARHLLKAIEVQETSGGAIICLLNAETLRNAYTNERKELAKRLKEYGAEIKYCGKAFKFADRPTGVEVACVKVIVPEPERQTTIFDRLREKDYEEFERKQAAGELAELDFVKSFVALYNRELEWGLRLYDEYLELQGKALDGSNPLRLKISAEGYESGLDNFSVNRYVTAVRKKYWDKFFRHPKFASRMTSNLANKYHSQVNEFAGYDFSYYNIKTVQEEVARSLLGGVEACIIGLFDELSHKYSWNEELQLDNIHYYNGWKTNISWKINRRVIIPLMGFIRMDKNDYRIRYGYEAMSKLSDIEKVLNYLDNGETHEINLHYRLEEAEVTGQTRKIRLKYFEVTFYKKGTCHITFRNERLLKKLNIFGSQRKGWLPNGYARRKYEDMDAEEQAVIESFEGREAYEETLKCSEYYLTELTPSRLMLTAE